MSRQRGPHGSRKSINRYNPNAPDWNAVHRPAVFSVPRLPVMPGVAALLGTMLAIGHARRSRR